MKINILGVAWIGIKSTSEATRTFYKDLFSIENAEITSSYVYGHLTKDLAIEILSPSSAELNYFDGQNFTVAYLVTDLHSIFDYFKVKGINLVSSIKTYSTSSEEHLWFYFKDPEDNIFLMLERKFS